MSIAILLSSMVFLTATFAQQPSPTPLTEDAVRVLTEEVHLTLSAEGPIRGFIPKLRVDDFTIYEDGVPQVVTSIRSLPANVLLLIDTGAALTFAKDRETLDVAAQLFVGNLLEKSAVSVVQYNDRVETLVPWTSDKEIAFASMSGAVRSGRRSLLKEALEYALASLASRPRENRHLVLITDGLDRSTAFKADAVEFKDLEAANVVIHIISLTKMEQDRAKEAAKIVRLNTRPSRPRVPREVFDDMVDALPVSQKHKDFLKLQNDAPQILIVDLDRERRKMLRARRELWASAELQLSEASVDSGGEMRTPIDAAGLLTAARDVGRSIGWTYDVTYAPAKAISGEREKLFRTISVTSHSDVIKLRTRKSLAVTK